MKCSIFTSLKSVMLFFAFCSLFAGRLSAQYSTAAQYPFVATTAEFQYLTGGTVVNAINVDDGQATNIPIGFSFPFCNNSYTTGSVSSNLWFSLSTTTATGVGVNNDNSNFNQFSTNNSLPVLMPFFDDLGWVFGGTASYLTTGTAPNRVFTFEWRNWAWDFSLPKASISIQMKLYENGSIQYLYKRENGGIGSQLLITTGWFSASIGIARTTADFQFLNGSTMFSTPVTNVMPTFDARPFTHQSFMWLAPCTDLQTATIEGPDDVCAGKTFTLAAVSQPSVGLGNNCQWSYSDNGINYTNITTTTSGTITDVITNSRWYKATITCGSKTYTTAPRLVKVAPHYKCYCPSTATVTNSSSGALDIAKVNLVDWKQDTILNNYDESLALTNNLYSVKLYTDFTQEFKPPVDMNRDSTYQIIANVINWSAWADGAVSGYIDYNHNSVFDSFERIIFKVAKNAQPTPGQVADTFTIPDTAKIGITRMRIILEQGTALPDSCGVYSAGETEDYLVNINYPPCNGPANAGIVEGDTSMCAGYGYVVTDTTYEKFQGQLARIWQHSADNINWFDVPNSAGKDSLQRVFGNQTLYYRVRMICLPSDDTTYSNVLRIAQKPAYKCYCFSQAEGGVENDSSDIGGFKIYNFAITDGGTHLDNPRAVRPRTDYTDLTPIVMWVDSVYDFYVFHTMPRGHHEDAKITVFMDFNNDHQYNIPEERVYTGFTNVGYHTLVSQVLIPNAAIVDVPTGMRIILNNNVGPNVPSDNACGAYTSGETEDYMIWFKRPFNVKVEELKSLEHVLLYPNPATGKFNLYFSNNMKIENLKLNITTVTGQQVYNEVYSHAGGRFTKEIDLTSQPKGVYIVSLDADGVKLTRRLVIE